MKVLFVTTESMLDHSYTMIRELRKHITLDVIITAKKMTPELERKPPCKTHGGFSSFKISALFIWLLSNLSMAGFASA